MYDCKRCLLCQVALELGEHVVILTGGYIGKWQNREFPITVANHLSDTYDDSVIGCFHLKCLFQFTESCSGVITDKDRFLNSLRDAGFPANPKGDVEEE